MAEQATALGLGSEVHFLGERTDVESILKGADFSVVPSRAESGPLVLIEYLVAGLPFVATRIGAVAERLAQLEVPGIVDPDRADLLSAAIDQLLTLSPAERSARAAIGPAIARRHFDISRALPLWYDVYERAVKDRAG